MGLSWRSIKNCSRPNSWNSKSYISETYNSLPVGRQRSSCTADNQVVLQPDAEEGTTALHGNERRPPGNRSEDELDEKIRR